MMDCPDYRNLTTPDGLSNPLPGALPVATPGACAPYLAPWWLGNAHSQTVYPALFAKCPAIAYRRERWECTPHGVADSDFIDVDRLAGRDGKPMLVVFHGLEGSSQRDRKSVV